MIEPNNNIFKKDQFVKNYENIKNQLNSSMFSNQINEGFVHKLEFEHIIDLLD